jgi:hypothetical protein
MFGLMHIHWAVDGHAADAAAVPEVEGRSPRGIGKDPPDTAETYRHRP